MEEEGNSKQRPLWFVFPGLSSLSMRASSHLMRIPTFVATIERAANVLRSLNFDLMWILTEAPENAFEDDTNSMVSIVAMQIALVDVLRAIGLYPDRMFGLSLGEIATAYVDDTLTFEETMLTTYWLGRCMMEAKVPTGPKALLYMTKDELEKRRPADLEVTYFTLDCVAVAGPDQSVKDIFDVLSSEGINGRIGGTAFMQYHTKYVEPAMPAFRKHLKTIISDPKPHSSKWISTSMPPDKWNSGRDEFGNLINSEFFVNNIRDRVDLVTPCLAMPENAVLVEISANACALKYMTYLPETITRIELLREEASYSTVSLLETIGRIFEATGQQPPSEQISKIFGNQLNKLNSEHYSST